MPHSNAKVNFYLVSDSSGETVEAIYRAVLAQFQGIIPTKNIWRLVRNKERVNKLIAAIKKKDGIIIYTMADEDVHAYMIEQCNKHHIRYISALGSITKKLASILHMEASRKISGWQHAELDAEYFKRIFAVEYSIKHDDGNNQQGLLEADIVLLGVSRTSKSPTSLYLAQHGYKTGNIPLIPGIPLQINLAELSNPLVIGLTISIEKLKQIRINRIAALGNLADRNDYIDDETIRTEMQEARKLFAQFNIQTLDVTGKAIEETAAEIINLYQEHIKNTAQS